mgnify:CR=1 FL=1
MHPVAVVVLSTAALWAWHLPQWYAAALGDDRLHALEHLTLLGSALLFWWVLSPQAGRQRVPAGVESLLLFAAAVQSAVLGALITFAPTPWIAAYRVSAPLWGLTALTDQQAAGALMWGPMGLVYIVAALGLLAQRLLRTQGARGEL